MNLRAKYLTAIALSLLASSSAWATWRDTSDCPFCVTFDTGANNNIGNLPNTGSNLTWHNDQVIGWFIQSSGSTAFNDGSLYNTGSGSSSTAGVYDFGNGTANDRSLGGIAGGTVGNIAYGLLIHNTTGATLNNLYISYTGEQWRNSGAGAQTLSVSYAKATAAQGTSTFFGSGYSPGTGVSGNLTPGTTTGSAGGNTWVAAPAGSTFTSPVTGGSATALNGTLAANSANITFSLTGLALESNAYLMLRWLDVDDTSVSDHALAIDNVCVSLTAPVPETSTYVAGAAVALMVGGTAWRRRSQKRA
jgi:hypothetical protein